MRLAFRLGFALSAALVIGGAYYVFLVPKIGHANEAEIEAALPPSLKVADAPDPAARDRYDRIVDLSRPFRAKAARRTAVPLGHAPELPPLTAEDMDALAKIETVLEAGPLRSPGGERSDAFMGMTACRDISRKMSAVASEARRRGDRKACLLWTLRGLRFADAVRGAGGVVIDALVASAVDAIATRTAYVNEVEGAFDDEARRQILALIPPQDGSSPMMADAVRREFRLYLLPILLHPEAHFKELSPGPNAFDPEEEPLEPRQFAGTFDPLETAREAGSLYQSVMDDLRGPVWRAKHVGYSVIEQEQKELPKGPLPGGSDFFYRCAMNAGHNTLGRVAATSMVLTELGSATARNAAYRNLARAVILLRMGKRPDVLDPFDGKPLRVDPSRKIVWSVNQDRKDDGGAIQEGGMPTAPDLGFPYGDHSFPLKAR